MLKADNYTEYNYDQASGEKHMGQKQYTIKGLSIRSESGVELQSWDQRSGSSQRSDIRRLMKEDK